MVTGADRCSPATEARRECHGVDALDPVSLSAVTPRTPRTSLARARHVDFGIMADPQRSGPSDPGWRPPAPPVHRETPDEAVARLERDMEKLRALLQEHLVQREAVEEELRDSVAQYRLAAESLRRSEERYRSLFRRAAHGIFRATPEGACVDVNPARVKMLGYESEDELLSLNMSTAVYRDAAEQASVVARLAAGDLREWAEVRWRMKDGTPISVRIAMHAVYNEEGAIESYEGIAEDITERRRRDELLRRSERMASLGTTLAGVAHELNNPLAAIGGFAQLMLRDGNYSEEDRAALQTIHHESNRAAKIVRDLLTFARREEGEQRERVDLNDVIGYLMATQRYAMETRGIEREVHLAPNLPPVFAERTQIEQVALNLLVNARQALEGMIDAPAQLGP